MSAAPLRAATCADGVVLQQSLVDPHLLARVRRAFARGDVDRIAALDADTPFDELGIDSLDLAEIAAELELEFGVAIDDNEFRAFTCLREVAEHLAAVRD